MTVKVPISKQYKKVSVWMTEEMYQFLQSEAHKRERDMSEFIRTLIIAYKKGIDKP